MNDKQADAAGILERLAEISREIVHDSEMPRAEYLLSMVIAECQSLAKLVHNIEAFGRPGLERDLCEYAQLHLECERTIRGLQSNLATTSSRLDSALQCAETAEQQHAKVLAENERLRATLAEQEIRAEGMEETIRQLRSGTLPPDTEFP